MITSIAIICACTLMGALARHGLGGKWRRWQAVAVFIGVSLPTIYAYALTDWLHRGLGVALIAGFFLHLLCKQEFGNLWRGLLRNCAFFPFISIITGTWFTLACIIPVFIVLKWARKDDPDVVDEHRIWEMVLGANTGFAMTAPLFASY